MIRNYTTIDITNESESIINITNENDIPINKTFNKTNIIIIIVKGYKQERATNVQGWKTVQIVSNVHFNPKS